jgi:hypothetical protein
MDSDRGPNVTTGYFVGRFVSRAVSATMHHRLS